MSPFPGVIRASAAGNDAALQRDFGRFGPADGPSGAGLAGPDPDRRPGAFGAVRIRCLPGGAAAGSAPAFNLRPCRHGRKCQGAPCPGRGGTVFCKG